MTKWNSNMSAAPRDGRTILVYGQPSDVELGTYHKPGFHTAHWDELDQAFCLSGGTWLGPFIDPTHWAEVTSPEGEQT